jgi:site-specific recombinase
MSDPIAALTAARTDLAKAFPVGFLLAQLYWMTFGVAPAGGKKAESLVSELHPFSTGTLFYTAVAGVFLFSGGLVSGWVANSSHHSNVPARLAAHPVLIGVLGAGGTRALSGFVGRHLGAVRREDGLAAHTGATG